MEGSPIFHQPSLMSFLILTPCCILRLSPHHLVFVILIVSELQTPNSEPLAHPPVLLEYITEQPSQFSPVCTSSSIFNTILKRSNFKALDNSADARSHGKEIAITSMSVNGY